MLAILTEITPCKVKFEWTKFEQYAFDEINRILACDTLLDYPYFNEEFKIHTNASDFQLGNIISQKGKIIALYCRKITGAHKRYTVTEKELLSIVETLRGFRTIFLGQILRSYTYHKNLTCKFLILIEC